jgi:hypothetical protein
MMFQNIEFTTCLREMTNFGIVTYTGQARLHPPSVNVRFFD